MKEGGADGGEIGRENINMRNERWWVLPLFKTLVAGDTQYSSIREDASAGESADEQGERSSLSSSCFSKPANQFFCVQGNLFQR